jgi:hypothetical protein
MAYRPIPIATTIPSDDTSYDGIAARLLPQRVDRIGFTKVISNNVDSAWGAIIGGIGAGMGVNQTGGNLVITSGTTARSETIIRSTASWEGGIRLRVRNTLSQRIINQNFFVELVDVIGDGLSYNIISATSIEVTIPSNPFNAENVGQSMYIGGFSGTGTFLSGRYTIASVSGSVVTFTVSGFAAGTGTCSLFGWNYYQLLYTGTTATQANFDTQRNGWNSGFTTPTINTTASPGHLAIITGNDLTATFSDQLVASGATVAVTPRASRVENVPDDVPLRLQIRVLNLGTAPASNTTWTIGLVSVANFAAQDIAIQDVRPTSVAVGIPVDVVRTVVGPTQPVSGTVTANQGTMVALPAGTAAIGDVGIQARTNATGAASKFHLVSAATTNATSVKAAAGRLLGWRITNTNAAFRYVKLHNTATAPTAGAGVVETIGVPPNTTVSGHVGVGSAFTTGIGITTVTGATDADNTAVGAADLIIDLYFA